MLRATGNKGFQLTFRNKLTISVQWGRGNYATGVTEELDMTSALSAEVMIWCNDTDRTLSFGRDEVKGWLSSDQVAIIIHNTAAAVSIPDLETRLAMAGFIDLP